MELISSFISLLTRVMWASSLVVMENHVCSAKPSFPIYSVLPAWESFLFPRLPILRGSDKSSVHDSGSAPDHVDSPSSLRGGDTFERLCRLSQLAMGSRFCGIHLPRKIFSCPVGGLLVECHYSSGIVMVASFYFPIRLRGFKP